MSQPTKSRGVMSKLTKPSGTVLAQRAWIESEAGWFRMLTALERGVKGGGGSSLMDPQRWPNAFDAAQGVVLPFAAQWVFASPL